MAEALFAEFEAATYEDWLEAVRASLPGKPFESLVTSSYEGIAIYPLPHADQLARHLPVETLPGQFPFVRGTSAAGYRGNPWLIAQEIELADPREFNLALQDALANGQTAITLIDSLGLNEPDDLRQALADIDWRRFPLFVRSQESAPEIYTLLRAAFTEEELMRLHGCVGCDPLGAAASTGSLPADSFERMAAHLQAVDAGSPSLGSIAVSTEAYHDAGANAVQELAIALATGVAYLRELKARGLDVTLIAEKAQVFLSIGENFFMEVAKFRAIKPLWAQMLRAFGVNADRQKLRLHARSGNRNKTLRESHINLLRLTTEALSAGIGGVDSICLLPFDALLGTVDGNSRRLSRNLQLILQEELLLTQLIDPAGGSWHVEKLTDELARAAWARFQEIEARGGLLAALRSGSLQAEIEAVADQRKRDMAIGDAILIGGNKYVDPDTTPPSSQYHHREHDGIAGDETAGIRPFKPIRLAEPSEAPQQQPGTDS